MTTEQLTQFSESLADSVATAAPSVVQVHGAGRPASGLVFAPDIVITTMRALGREDGLQVRGHDGSTSRRSAGRLGSDDEPCAVACGRARRRAHRARNRTTARRPSRACRRTIVEQCAERECGHRCGHGRCRCAQAGGRAIDQVIRTTAPMHDGFAGGALVDTTGGLLGVITATRIRGTTVVIPASIAWKAASSVLEHGGLKRGYLGIAGQPVRLPANPVRVRRGYCARVALAGSGFAHRRGDAGESGGGRRSHRGRHHSGA